MEEDCSLPALLVGQPLATVKSSMLDWTLGQTEQGFSYVLSYRQEMYL